MVIEHGNNPFLILLSFTKKRRSIERYQHCKTLKTKETDKTMKEPPKLGRKTLRTKYQRKITQKFK